MASTTQQIAIEIAGRVANSLGRSVEGVNNKLGSIGEMASKAAKIAGSAFAALEIGSFIKDSIGLYSEFEQKMADVQSQTGLTDEQMKAIEQSSKNLFENNYGEDISDIADSMATVRQQTKLYGADLEQATKSALILSDTFDFEVSESTRAAQMMIQQFGMESEEAYNLIAQGAQAGLDKNQNLLDSVNEYSLHFKKVGLDAEDMFNVFDSAADVGVFDLDKIGDAVKEFSIRSIDGSKTTIQAYQALGLSADEMTQKFGAGGDTASEAFAQTIKAIESVKDPIKQDAIGVSLFGTMWEDMGKQAIFALDDTNGAISTTKDTLDEINQQKYGTLQGSLGVLQRKFETFRINAIEKISPYLNQMMNGIIDGIEFIETNIGPILDRIKGYIEPFMPYIESVGNSVLEVATETMELLTGTILPMLKPAFDIAVQVISGIAQRIGPYVANMVGAFKNIILVVKDIYVELASKLKPIFDNVFNFISNTLVPKLMVAFDLIAPKVVEIVNKVVPCVQAIWNYISPIIDALVGAINFAMPYIKSVISNNIDGIIGFVSNLFDAIGQLIDFITNVFTGNWSAAWENVVNIFGSIFGGIIDIAKSPLNTVIDLVNGVISKINGISVSVPDWVPGIGGESFGVDIPQIPHLAQGGIATRSTIAEIGEGSEPEAVTPISKLASFINGYIGQPTQNQSPVYSPQIIIQGNANKEDVQEALKISQSEFERMYMNMIRKNNRVSFSM